MQHTGVPLRGTAVAEENTDALGPGSMQVSVRGAKPVKPDLLWPVLQE